MEISIPFVDRYRVEDPVPCPAVWPGKLGALQKTKSDRKYKKLTYAPSVQFVSEHTSLVL